MIKFLVYFFFFWNGSRSSLVFRRLASRCFHLLAVTLVEVGVTTPPT